MKLYTGQGDDGTTGLFGSARVPKDDPQVAACGDIDETNAAIGSAITCLRTDSARIATLLRQVQCDLFTLGAELATKQGHTAQHRITEADVARLERWIDSASADVPPLNNFILPDGSEAASRLHQARAVCRRAERTIVGLAHKHSVSRSAAVYLNRLSDLLFALARQANHQAGVADVPWTPSRSD